MNAQQRRKWRRQPSTTVVVSRIDRATNTVTTHTMSNGETSGRWCWCCGGKVKNNPDERHAVPNADGSSAECFV